MKGKLLFVVPLALVAVLLGAGCGGTGATTSSPSAADRQRIERVLADFALHVDRGNQPEMCELLVGKARREQGCGTAAADISPQLSLAIGGAEDIELEQISGDRALASFPDYRLRAFGPKPKQLVRQGLALTEAEPGKWRISEISYGPNVERSGAVLVRGCDARVGDGRHMANPQDILLGNALLGYAHENAPVRMGGVFGSGKRQAGKWRAFKTVVVLNGAEATLHVPPR